MCYVYTYEINSKYSTHMSHIKTKQVVSHKSFYDDLLSDVLSDCPTLFPTQKNTEGDFF